MTTAAVERSVEGLVTLLCGSAFGASMVAAEAAAHIPDEVYHQCAGHGLFALAVSPEYGGLGLSVLERTRLHAIVARTSASLHSMLVVHEMAVHAIGRFGGARLAGHWLPRLAAGQDLGAFALTEPAGGSEFQQITSYVEPGEDGLLLHGTKSWVSSGQRAGVVVTFARSPAGPVALLVPIRTTPGITIAAAPELSAFRAAAMAGLSFERCLIPEEYRLGHAGLGLMRVATACLTVGRVLVAAGALAVATAALDALIHHAGQRTVGSEPLGARQLVRKSVADAYRRIQGGQLLTEQAARAVDDRDPQAATHAVVAKLAAADAVGHTTRDALRLHGAAGLRVDAPVLRYAAEARVYEAIEGNTEALTNALGAALVRTGIDMDRSARS